MSGNSNVRSHGLIATGRWLFFSRRVVKSLRRLLISQKARWRQRFPFHSRVLRRVGARNCTCTWARVSERAIRQYTAHTWSICSRANKIQQTKIDLRYANSFETYVSSRVQRVWVIWIFALVKFKDTRDGESIWTNLSTDCNRFAEIRR